MCHSLAPCPAGAPSARRRAAPRPYNGRVSATTVRVQVIAGALTPTRWLPAAAIAARLPRLAPLVRAGRILTREAAIETVDGALPMELAHDTFLRSELAAAASIAVPAGAMTALRRLATAVGESDAWLLEPVHFHLARDHLVLETRAAEGLDPDGAARLTDAIAPLLAAESFVLDRISVTHWRLRTDSPAAPLNLRCASPEAAAGRNVDGYLPTGPDARRYRRLLNEIQMTWHAMQRDGAEGSPVRAPINSVWLSGPVTPAAGRAWRSRLDGGRLKVDERLLAARLHDDPGAWLDALGTLDADLRDALTAGEATAVLLCGDSTARWLAPAAAARALGGRFAPASAASRAAVSREGLAGILAGLRERLQPRRASSGPSAAADVVAALFAEGATR